MSAVAVEDMHGRVLFKIDVCLPLPISVSTRKGSHQQKRRDGLVNMRWRVRFAYILIGTTYIATVLSILLGCHPMHKNWQIYPNPGSAFPDHSTLATRKNCIPLTSADHCQPAISEIDVYVTVVLNVATDIYLITIPTPVLNPIIFPSTDTQSTTY